MAPEDLVRRWADAEALYRKTEHRGVDEPDLIRITGTGRTRFIFSAPHSVRSVRNGGPKTADMGSGGLAELLAEQLEGLAITTYGRQSGDPNWDRQEGEFKRELLRGAGPGSIVVDLHGMSDRWDHDLIGGLGPVPGLARALGQGLLAAAARHHLRARTGPPFDAARPGTVTAALQAAGIRAIQVEVAGSRRRPITRPALAAPLIETLLDWLRPLA